jgi:hypothetical protein
MGGFSGTQRWPWAKGATTEIIQPDRQTSIPLYANVEFENICLIARYAFLVHCYVC